MAQPVEVMTANQRCRCHQMYYSSFGSIDGEAVVEIGWRSLLGGSTDLPQIQSSPAHVSPDEGRRGNSSQLSLAQNCRLVPGSLVTERLRLLQYVSF